jgi:diguanylate cyclase (GGDEF)-like protein
MAYNPAKNQTNKGVLIFSRILQTSNPIVLKFITVKISSSRIHMLKQTFYNRKTLLIILCFLLLFTFTFTSLISYRITRDALTTNLKTETLPLISDNIFSEIQQDLISPIENSSLMANDEFLIDWVHSGEKNTDEITRYLSRIIHEYGYFSSFFVSENTKNYYYYGGILKQISIEDEHDIWYYTFRAADKKYDLDVDTNQASQDTVTIFINHRLQDQNGTFLGVTGVGLEMQSIGKTLEHYRERYRHEVYMIDASGLIQVHPDQELIETTNIKNLPGIGALSQQILSNTEGTNIYEYNNGKADIVISTRYFPDFDWFLIVEQDKTDTLKSARTSLMINISVGVFVTLLFTLLAVTTVNLFQKRLELMATSDDLTGLFNRRKFEELFQREIFFAKRYQHQLSLLFIDIDNFKSINDTYGHPVGDLYLKKLAGCLSEGIREIDVLGRWGGEEFIIMLNQTGPEEAFLVAERLRLAAAEIQINTANQTLSTTISIGITTSTPDTLDRQILIKQADQALLTAKRSGKNKSCSTNQGSDN